MKKTMTILALASMGVFAAGSAVAQEDLAQKSGCLNCHAVATKKVGPSFKDIAAKYKGQADAEAKLTTELSTGKGHPAVKASAEATSSSCPFLASLFHGILITHGIIHGTMDAWMDEVRV